MSEPSPARPPSGRVVLTSGEAPAAPACDVDPAEPIAKGDTRSASGRFAQRQRRARILASARRLIAERGVEHVTLRSLAETSDLSVQTIYNLVGNRMEVVEAAISEHIESVAQTHRDLDSYPSRFLAVGDLMWMNLMTNAAYSRNASIACFQSDELRRRVHQRHSGALRRMLERQFGDEARRKRIDLDAAANVITIAVGGIAADWAKGAMDDLTLRYRLTCAYGLAVAGLVTEEQQAAISDWLDRAKQAIPRIEVT